jgi:hypothetical protein
MTFFEFETIGEKPEVNPDLLLEGLTALAEYTQATTLIDEACKAWTELLDIYPKGEMSFEEALGSVDSPATFFTAHRVALILTGHCMFALPIEDEELEQFCAMVDSTLVALYAFAYEKGKEAQ